jgi:predicted TIM-barrel fold metal-dependent hydrolase
VVRALLEEGGREGGREDGTGIDVTVKDSGGRTAREIAEMWDHEECARLVSAEEIIYFLCKLRWLGGESEGRREDGKRQPQVFYSREDDERVPLWKKKAHTRRRQWGRGETREDMDKQAAVLQFVTMQQDDGEGLPRELFREWMERYMDPKIPWGLQW